MVDIMDSPHVSIIDGRMAALTLVGSGVWTWQEFANLAAEEVEAVDLQSSTRTLLLLAHVRASK